MSKRPPEDDSFIDKILKEFDASMNYVDDDVDGESKEAMKAALRESIQMWFPHIGMEPEMEVLDGDKAFETSASEASTDESQREALRSQFQILDEEEDLLREEDPFPNVQVRVLSPKDLLGGGHSLFGLGSAEKQLPKRGNIVLDVNETLLVVQRSVTAPYRISCDKGRVKIHTESNQYELRAGQSMDMDAMSISVEGVEVSTGWYQSI